MCGGRSAPAPAPAPATPTPSADAQKPNPANNPAETVQSQANRPGTVLSDTSGLGGAQGNTLGKSPVLGG